MPNVSWDNNYDPNPVFKLIEECKVTDPSGAIRFQGIGFAEYFTLICGMLKFPDFVPEIERNGMVRRAIVIVCKNGPITNSRLLAEINRLVNTYENQPITRYVLVTSWSLKYVESLRRINMNGAIIIFDPQLSSRYQAERMKVISNAKYSLCVENPTNYFPVRVHVSARSTHEAVDIAFKAFNIVRGIWNWSYNRKKGLRMSNGRREPVNRLVLGPIHTLHYPGGKLATESWWYEPNYCGQVATWDLSQEMGDMYKFLDSVRRRLSECMYKEDLEQVIIRYGLALDERDWETAFLKLWGCLEDLTCTASGNSYKETIRRATFIFENRDYYMQVLTCLKDYRNRFVHDAENTGAIETYLYQLKGYIELLLRFHLWNKFDFPSLKAASEFLDLPSDKDALNSRIELAKQAQKFLRHS